ncbi:MAG: tetratricopeptide repeat protein [Bacteroidales bacterium]|jgi:tetratricopeptide (TPR) repeat protein|nr:tetratricopeptide repeat protein [Bacteroidales bacterium]
MIKEILFCLRFPHLLCFLYCLCVYQLSAQGKENYKKRIDSLFNLYSKAKNPEKNRLAIHYGYALRLEEPTESKKLMLDALAEAESLGYLNNQLEGCLQYAHRLNGDSRAKEAIPWLLKRDSLIEQNYPASKLQATNYIFLANFYQMINNLDSSYYYLGLAMPLFRELNDKNGMGVVYERMGRAALVRGEFDTAIARFNRSAEYLAETDSIYLLIRNKYYLGLTNHYLGNYELGIFYLLESLRIMEGASIFDLPMRWNINEMVGNIYAAMHQYENALKYHRRALAIRRQNYEGVLPDSINLSYAYSYNNIAEAWLHLGDTDSAAYYADISLRIKLQKASTASLSDIANSYLNLALIKKAQNDVAQSLQLAKKADSLYALGQVQGDQARALVLIASLYAKFGHNADAVKSIDKALDIAEQTNSKALLKSVYKEKASLLADQNNYEAGYEALMNFNKLKDSVFYGDLNKRIAEMQVLFDVERSEKEKELIQLRYNQLTQSSKYYRVLGVIAALLALSFAIMLYLLRVDVSRKKSLLQKKEEINSLNEQKYEQELQHKNREMQLMVQTIRQKNQMLEEVKTIMAKEIRDNCNAPIETFHKTISVIRSHIHSDYNWDILGRQMEAISFDFQKKLLQLHPKLTTNDLQLCTYILLNLPNHEIAAQMNIANESVRKQKYRLRKRLNLKEESLESYLNSL